MSLPEILDARTPAEAKRHWMIDRLWIGSIFGAVILVALIGIFWLGNWSPRTETKRLNILAGIAFGVVGYQLIVVLSFSLGGPVGRWRARWGDKHVDAQGDNHLSPVDQAYDSGGAA